MSLLDLMTSRRSVRRFIPNRIIPKSLLDQIVEAGHVAPSACNKQPWHFFLIQSEEAKRKIQDCYDRSWVKDASAYILVAGEVNNSWKHPDGYGDTSLYTDCGIATTHMMLEAWSEGIASVWICAFDRAKCCQHLGLNMEGVRPISILALGYADVDVSTLPFNRKDISEVLTVL